MPGANSCGTWPTGTANSRTEGGASSLPIVTSCDSGAILNAALRTSSRKRKPSGSAVGAGIRYQQRTAIVQPLRAGAPVIFVATAQAEGRAGVGAPGVRTRQPKFRARARFRKTPECRRGTRCVQGRATRGRGSMGPDISDALSTRATVEPWVTFLGAQDVRVVVD
jgi:hypothetical protein